MIIKENDCMCGDVDDFINIVKVSIHYWLFKWFFTHANGTYFVEWDSFGNSIVHFFTSFHLFLSQCFYSAPQALCVPQSADILTKVIIQFFPSFSVR